MHFIIYILVIVLGAFSDPATAPDLDSAELGQPMLRTSSSLSEWLWGGLQCQAEHHLIPTMQRYRYAVLAPVAAAILVDRFDIEEPSDLIRN